MQPDEIVRIAETDPEYAHRLLEQTGLHEASKLHIRARIDAMVLRSTTVSPTSDENPR